VRTGRYVLPDEAAERKRGRVEHGDEADAAHRFTDASMVREEKREDMTHGTQSEKLETASIRLAPADRVALQSEALRRVRRGETRRIDVSSVVRELIRDGLKRRAGEEPGR